MAEKNNNGTSVFMNGKEYAELIRYQFTDDTRQTLESVTVFLKDRYAEYGYLPETDVIPIAWIEKYGEENWADYGTQYNAITEMLKEWRKENGRS